MKLWKAEAQKENVPEGVPGEVVKVERDTFCIQTGDGILKIEEVQLEGKKRMDTAAFLRGFHLSQGERLD